MRNVLIIAGEASGDLYGAHLARELKALDSKIEIWGCGGPKMEEAGVELIFSTDEFAVIGFSEILHRLPFFVRALRKMKSLVDERKPAVAVPIDYPGFNLRLASFCAAHGVPVAYYISPQVWAWGWGRVRRIRRVVDRMIVTFPFEEEIYSKENVPVSFAGHPLVEIAKPSIEPEAFRRNHGLPATLPVAGLFPGSRPREVESLLGPMIEAVERLNHPEKRVAGVIGAPAGLDRSLYDRIANSAKIPVVRDETYDLLNASRFAFVASGTMTVEAACLGTPMAIVYRVAPLSWILGRLLVRVPHIGMANLLAGERVVPEFLQGDVTGENLAAAARPWLDDPALCDRIRRKLLAVRDSLGEEGASRRAARLILDTAEGK